MAGSDLGSWDPLPLAGVAERFAAAPFRWWISGGHALELHLGRSWRTHDDTDVGVVRAALHLVHDFLSDWDLHVAADGTLSPWHGRPLDPASHENNLWCRPTPDAPWVLDITVGEGSETDWIHRRDPSVTLPWDVAVLQTSDGIPYLAPELQLLCKSEGLRAKDRLDAEQVIPELDAARQRRLASLLDKTHPWQSLLR